MVAWGGAWEWAFSEKQAQGFFVVEGSVLKLNWGNGHTGVYIYTTSADCTLSIGMLYDMQVM